MTIRRTILTALCLTGITGYAIAQDPSPAATPMDAPNNQLVSACISRIHTRLTDAEADYPQLSEFGTARTSLTSLVYTKGDITWPDGKLGGPHYSDLNGCQLKVSLSYPVPQERAIGAMDQGTYYPESQLQLEILFFCTGERADSFREFVLTTIRTDVDALAETLKTIKQNTQQGAAGYRRQSAPQPER